MNLRHLRDLKPETEIDERGIREFARANYQHLKWNGRQIRNAFQSAYALAEYQVSLSTNQGSSDATTRLNAGHFEKVAQITLNFEKYLFEIYGGDDGDRAKHDQLRRDHWGGNLGSSDPAPQPLAPQMTGVIWPYQSTGQNPPPAQRWQQGVSPMPGGDPSQSQAWATGGMQMPAQYAPQNMAPSAGWPPNLMVQGQNLSQNPMPMRGTAKQPPPQNPSGNMFGIADTRTPLQNSAPYLDPASESSDDDC